MRLSNRSKTGYYNFLNSFLLMILAAGIAAFILEMFKFDILGWEGYLLILVPLILLFGFYMNGRQIFEYDSDGEALNFKNRNVLLFLDKPLNDEFPKYKLKKFEIVKFLFFKRLYVTITSKKSNFTTLKYDISYLTKKELGDLKYSLNKVIKENKQNLH